ncbi:hypothetical protein L9F63_010997, partial [Diploptera punctata]
IECHPYLNQLKLIDFCTKRNVVVTAHSPLGGAPKPTSPPGTPMPITDPKIKEIADRQGKSVAQVIIRWLIQHGVVPIPKSSNRKRLEENFNVFCFELSCEEMDSIDALNKNIRVSYFPKNSVPDILIRCRASKKKESTLHDQAAGSRKERSRLNCSSGHLKLSVRKSLKAHYHRKIQPHILRGIQYSSHDEFSVYQREDKMTVPTVKLNNGYNFPVLGCGTYKAGNPGEVADVVKNAIDVGFRHIDCAMFYDNEPEIGQAIKEKIAEGVIKREDLFITSKLWNNNHRPDLVVPACKKTLSDLGLDYLDLYLIHWPHAVKEGGEPNPLDEDGKLIPSDVDYVDTWKQMEECLKLGLAKSIGLSNFNSVQIQRILDVATIRPVVNQVECHPYLNQSKLLAFCKERQILLTAYSPLGSPGILAGPDTPAPLKDPKIIEIAEKHGKTVAQTIIRYLIQHGVVPIPKSSNKKRLEENFNVFDFELTAEEVASIDGVNKNFRICPYIEATKHRDYPFNIEF